MNQFPPFEQGPFVEPWPLDMPARGARRLRNAMRTVPLGTPPVRTPERYAVFNGTKVFPATLASVNILQAPGPNEYRNALAIRNPNAAGTDIYIDFGSDASTNSICKLAPDEVWFFDAVVPQDDIYVIAVGGTGFVSIAYSVLPIE